MEFRMFRAAAMTVIGLLIAGVARATAETDLKDAMRFAADMAQHGNWREAKFRWEQAAALQPDDPSLLNNLAVAHEALGEPERARPLYEQALAQAHSDEVISDNKRRFERFWQDVGGAAAQPPEQAVTPREESGKVKGKRVKVTLKLPLPPRLDLSTVKNLLVISFLTEENPWIDTNRELVRFLRSEFRKYTALEVLDVNPPPSVPEQTVEDLIANVEFWKHLGQEHGAELIVSGVVSYDRKDASGFRSVDMTSPVTGHKVRQTRFVEQEQFLYELDIFFFDGETGTLRFRDRLQRGVIYSGQQNDPLTAFFELSESMAGDVLAVVTTRTREDSRVIFKR
jgi:hypothetical protein